MEPAVKREKLAEGDESRHLSAVPLEAGALRLLFNVLCRDLAPEDRIRFFEELRILFVYAFFIRHRTDYVNRFAAEAFLDQPNNPDADATLYREALLRRGDTAMAERLCHRIREILKYAFPQEKSTLNVPEDILHILTRKLPVESAVALQMTSRQLLWQTDRAAHAWQYYQPTIKVLGWDAIGPAAFADRVRGFPSLLSILFYISCLWTTDWKQWIDGRWKRGINATNSPLSHPLRVPPALTQEEMVDPDSVISRRAAFDDITLPRTTHTQIPTAADLRFLRSIRLDSKRFNGETLVAIPRPDNNTSVTVWGPGVANTYLTELGVYQDLSLGEFIRVACATSNVGYSKTRMDKQIWNSLQPRLVPYSIFAIFNILDVIMGADHPLLPIVAQTLIPLTDGFTMVGEFTPPVPMRLAGVTFSKLGLGALYSDPITVWDLRTAIGVSAAYRQMTWKSQHPFDYSTIPRIFEFKFALIETTM